MEPIICRLHKQRHCMSSIARFVRRLSTCGQKSFGGTGSRTHMSSWQIHQYGDTSELSLSTTAVVPTIHSPEEILVEVHAASINPIDVQMIGGYGQVLINMLRKQKGTMRSGSEFPLTVGRDFSGVIVEVGKKVKHYKAGDQVWGAIGAQRQGTHAQFTVTSENEISKKPEKLDHVDAASLPYVAATSWAALIDVGQLREESTPGMRILVNGGAGGIGTFSIQLLQAWGADVTTICSTDAVPMMHDLEVNTIIDYKTQDLASKLHKLDTFDFIFDPIGGETPEFFSKFLKQWTNAKYVSLKTSLLRNTDNHGAIRGGVMSAGNLLCKAIAGFRDGQNYRWAIFTPNGRALNTVAQMVDKENIKPVVEKIFPFEEVPQAIEKVAKGHSRGKTVIRVK